MGSGASAPFESVEAALAAGKSQQDIDAWIEKSKTSIVVYYWGPSPTANMYGRGIGIYLTLNQAGVKYEIKGPDAVPQGGVGKAIFAVPAVQIDDVLMSQTPAILGVLGKKFGLAGKTPAENMQVLQAVEDLNDVYSEHKKLAVAEGESRKNQWFSYLECKLQQTGWMGGTAEPSVADFHGVFAFEWILKAKVDFSDFSSLTQWWSAIQQYPVVAKMYASCVEGRKMIP